MKQKFEQIINSVKLIFIGNKLNEKQKLTLMKLAASTLLFIIGLFLGKIKVLEIIVFSLAYIISAYEVVLKAVKRAIRGNVFEEHMLMSVASIGAFIIGEFAEGCAVMILYSLGELFESLAVNRSRKLVKSMMSLRPDMVHKLKQGEIVDVPTSTIVKGDILVVRPGERVPVDGVIFDGVLEADVSAITGESLPVVYNEGDGVLSGYINLSSVVRVRATTCDAESTVSRILTIVEEQEANKSESEKLVTKFARYYTPAVFGITLILATIVPLIFGGFGTWIYRALSLLVISCPCALVISGPLTYFGGIGNASASGILLKGGSVIDALTAADTVIFDKTGTLTTGKLEVTGLFPASSASEKTLLTVAAISECGSNHPLARAVCSFAEGAGIDIPECDNFKEIAGSGCIASAGGHIFIGGSKEFLEKFEIQVSDSSSANAKRVFFAIDRVYAGYIELCDRIKDGAAEAVSALRYEGDYVIGMFSGDRREIAEGVAYELGFDLCESGLSPEGKLALLKERSENFEKVIFAGDGINDAPSLAEAHVGIAMGDIGSDAALEAADVVIMDGKLDKLARAIKIAKFTSRIVKENIGITLGVKLLVLILTICGLVGMTAAIFADVGVAVIAIINATRALTHEVI